ncbi:sialidase-1 [Lewinella aquimaris]|uniref:exo-alpha-sialidase n=1 Tax=Neolewinella aquimaris TaxID=1835722 RepID=A0A840EC91_9BACT|nr:sialidase family protein [Neolewinella aquimaris]MBB4081087.1 sialidase-1 [Neolewinella aquimaris]
MKITFSLLIAILCAALVTACKTPQRSDSLTIEARQPVLPILAGREKNKVLAITVTNGQGQSGTAIHSFSFSLEGSSGLSDIQRVQLLYSETGDFSKSGVVGTQSAVRTEFDIALTEPIVADTGEFWLSLELVDRPDLSQRITANLLAVELSDGTRVPARMSPQSHPQRIGLALRQAGEDGVDTYRIPGLATTNEGTLIGVYDVRYDDPVDLQENVDVGLSRSTDGGQTWEEMKIIMDMQTFGGLPEDQNGIGDPAVLVDRNTNTIWVAALWLHGFPGERAWNASQPGIEPAKTGQFVLVKSKDDGLTWSDPINVTAQMKNPAWQLFFNGPGKGITMSDGTLVFAAQFKDENRIPHSTIIYSKDGGETWTVGTGAKSETTEAQVVELSDGSLMLNMRDDRNRSNRQDTLNGRSVAITTDLGQTWTQHPTSRRALQESNCMASIIAYDHPEKGKVLFFSNPDTKVTRNHITIKTSFDDGMTWPEENQLELYEENTYGYSCMTMVDEDHIGILYEGNKELYFEKIALTELFAE